MNIKLPNNPLSQRAIGPSLANDLIDFQGWSRADVESLIARARELRSTVLESTGSEMNAQASGNPPLARRPVVALYFSEASTRTVGSFTVAATRLGADVISFSADRSSATKGETMLDTARTIDAFGVDVLVVRDASSGAPRRCTEVTRASVINAGDGVAGHPTQALLDALTLLDEYGDLDGKRIGIVGDVAHSRVARSNVELFAKLGAEVCLIGPPEFTATDLADKPGVSTTTDLEAALPNLDAIELLRIQHERHGDATLDLDCYIDRYQFDATRLARCADHLCVLHPGPMNRGVEITDDVADGPRSRIVRQVQNGVPIRMAALERAWLR